MGYDLCLFEDEDVDEELICPICRGVLGFFLFKLFYYFNFRKCYLRAEMRTCFLQRLHPRMAGEPADMSPRQNAAAERRAQ